MRANTPAGEWAIDAASHTVGMAFRPLQILIASPSWILLIFLGAALFRPPGPHFFPFDRVALAALLFTAFLCATARRQSLRLSGEIAWPLSALLLLSLIGVMATPDDPQAWSVFA
ncbi:MAG TPA: hypothetical protein VJQ82_26180, partial [Terriglobales bacterium]|nr:hypothetical protein [Terriglobales bacterium]